ncbi:hypothetical protein GIB67_016407 [Kingdonia uniflora]|uniref:Myosin motor domain-containing protein n=1 Tax=Kingdonia uniflora TaxID=39325 RepID=A0A7J7MGV7_9MAGN|nr:hypothetical protein GIB67_016407 [Kingdonia uniflora]
MATLQFKDDYDSMKVGLREFDSSWTWQANELRATSAVTVSCSQVPQDTIFRVVAAILHLGNIDFSKGKEIDSSIVKYEKSRFHLKMMAKLLIFSTLDPGFVLVSRDGLAKTIYSRLFDWLVDKISISIGGQDPNSKSIIGVLDIYGFESFKCNRVLLGGSNGLEEMEVKVPTFVIMGKKDYSLKIPGLAYSFNEMVRDYIPDMETIYLPDRDIIYKESTYYIYLPELCILSN